MLYPNGQRVRFSPATAVSGLLAQSGAMFYAGRSGARLNGAANFSKATSVPNGHAPFGTLVLPIKPGGVSSSYGAVVTVTATGSGNLGKAAGGAANVVVSATGTGGLISSATGTAGITLSVTGGLFASKAAQGTATIALTPTGTIKGVGSLGGAAGCTLGASWTPYAKGWLSGTTAEAGLTNAGIANSVWSKVVESGFSAEQILRIIAAQAAGAATGLENGNPRFTGLDGVTVRIDGTYVSGTRTIDSLNGD